MAVLSNRDMMLNGLEPMTNIYGTRMMYGGLMSPMTGTTATAAEIMFPMYGTADSGLSYAHFPVVSRKRSREDSNNSINMNNNQMVSYQADFQNPNDIYGGNNRSSAGQFTFLGEDFSSQMQHQQLEVDTFIAQHTEKVRLEIEERRKRYSRRIIAAVEEGIVKKLKVKEDEIQKIVKLNWALEERVKSLAVENEIWRDLAQTNEATANILRNNLEQVLAQVENDVPGGVAEVVDDAQSCCGSTVEDNAVVESNCHRDSGRNSYDKGSVRVCRSCGKDEACVLLLPCRHLCLCSVCGSSQNVCPVCKSTKSCSLHVNLTS